MSSQADALLAAAAEEDSELGAAVLGTMSLGADAYNTDDPDSIYDGEEPHIVVDKGRFITVPERLKRLGVQYDHNVETVTFDCPRYWDGHDMSTMKVYVNYIRSDRVPGTYPVKSPITIDETDSEVMHFNWTISREVTEAMGNIVFLVCIKKVDDEGNESEHWNSELCKDCYISEGLEVLDRIVNEYPDIITYMLTRLDLLDENIQQYVTDYLNNSDTLAETIKQYIDEHYTITTDTTLTVEGGIADAKATGDTIKGIVKRIDTEHEAISSDIRTIDEALPFTIIIDDEAGTINFIDR